MDIIKRFLDYLLIAVLAGFVLLLVAYALPNEPIRSNIAASMSMFDSDLIYPQWANGLTATSIDLWADAIVLQEACAEGGGSIIQKALLNPKFNNPGSGLLPPQILSLYTMGSLDLSNCIYNYPRYWHGYLIIVRPLLEIMTVGHIRVLNVTCQLVLFMYVCKLIDQKLGLIYIPPFFISWVVVNLFSAGLCFEYTFITYIALIAMSYLLRNMEVLLENPSKQAGIYDLLFLVGIATGYFDFLTYPLVGLGIPLCYWLIIRKPGLITGVKEIILISVSWVLGYGLMWSSKWVLASVLTDANVLGDGLAQVLYRTSGPDTQSFSAGQVIMKNLQLVGYKAFLIILIVIVLYYIKCLVKDGYRLKWCNNNLLFFVVAVMPFVWMAVVKNHCYVHSYMTHKILAVFFCACLCIVPSSMRKKEIDL